MPANATVDPATTTSPVAGSTAGLYTFATPVSAVFIKNASGQVISVGLNGLTASATDGHFMIANNASRTIDAKVDRVGSISTVSVWFPATATVGNFDIAGV